MFFLNLDFFYYLIYLFFRGIWDFIVGIFDYNLKDTNSTHINLLDLIKYYSSDKGEFQLGGIDGYSLFTPPNGAEKWGDNIFEAVGNWFYIFFHNPYCPSCPSFAEMFFGGINTFIIFLIILCFVILYFLKLREIELDKLDYEVNQKVLERDEKSSRDIQDEKWNNILNLIESTNKNDWKAAIIDADNMLDNLLIKKGYKGNSLGERLKSADFNSIQKAWEAHKVRNLIAHDSNFELSKREVKKVILNYSVVFKEIM